MTNNLAIVLIIYGFTIPGLEIISNALNSFANEQMSPFYCLLTGVCGFIYTLASFRLILTSSTSRLKLLLPLWTAFLLLLALKCVNNPSNSFKDICLLIADILPGLGKRLILLLAFSLGDQHNLLGKVFSLNLETEIVKRKKE